MSAPWFDYSIQRPYPYPWFTWVTMIGGTIFAVLISVFNFSSDGMYLKLVYTNNPNETLAQQEWVNKPPFSWAVKDQVGVSVRRSHFNPLF